MRAWVEKLNYPMQAEIVCEPARTSGDLPEYNVVECHMNQEVCQGDAGLSCQRALPGSLRRVKSIDLGEDSMMTHLLFHGELKGHGSL